VTELIPIRSICGAPLPLRGNDIDTDRIIPARFMKAITFDGLGRYAFHDQRFKDGGQELDHPMNDPRYQAKGPRIAVVNKNFGCGSSREHAPQALLRWGIKALVGESFADIFFGNCVALGLPCVIADETSIGRLLAAVEEDPTHEMTVDVNRLTVTYQDLKVAVKLPEGTRQRGRGFRPSWTGGADCGMKKTSRSHLDAAGGVVDPLPNGYFRSTTPSGRSAEAAIFFRRPACPSCLRRGDGTDGKDRPHAEWCGTEEGAGGRGEPPRAPPLIRHL
jgi:3-isopropylmalate/(R)-2-methylmalate dehydratase small subunit